MSKEQLHALKMALFLAQYFVEEHQDDGTEQWHIDNERVILAREILQELEAAQ
jgi:hypothetical protein|tara:strand:- start:3260 stop:3418 length:159 start_codon:yes stop_codon:yes gene_type:complete